MIFLDLKIPNGFSLTVPNIEHFTFHQIDSNFFLFTFSLGETEYLFYAPNEILFRIPNFPTALNTEQNKLLAYAG